MIASKRSISNRELLAPETMEDGLMKGAEQVTMYHIPSCVT